MDKPESEPDNGKNLDYFAYAILVLLVVFKFIEMVMTAPTYVVVIVVIASGCVVYLIFYS